MPPTKRLLGLTRIARSLAYQGGLAETLEALCREVAFVTDASACQVVLRDSRARLPRFRVGAAWGLPEAGRGLLERALDEGYPRPAWEVYTSRQGVFFRDRERLTAGVTGDAPEAMQALANLALQQAWESCAILPVVLGESTLGLLVAYYPPESPLNEDNLSYLETLAALSAVAIENARLVHLAEDRAALLERQRLALELHDSVSQTLYAIGLGVRTAQEGLRQGLPEAMEELERVAELAEGSQRDVRALLQALQPEILERQGLAVALELQAAVLRTRSR